MNVPGSLKQAVLSLFASCLQDANNTDVSYRAVVRMSARQYVEALQMLESAIEISSIIILMYLL